MDDTQPSWGGSLDTPKVDPKGEEMKRQLYLHSLDTIAVANTTEEDYTVDWDGAKWKVPAHGTRQMPRYVAKKFIKELKDKIINEMGDVAVTKEIANREKLGMKPLDSYEKQELYGRQPRTDNPKMVQEIYSKLWLGTVEEYGADDVLPEGNKISIETEPVEEQVLRTMNKRYVEPTEPIVPEKTNPTAKKLLVEL